MKTILSAFKHCNLSNGVVLWCADLGLRDSGPNVLSCCGNFGFCFLFPWSGRELEYSLNWKGKALTCDLNFLFLRG